MNRKISLIISAVLIIISALSFSSCGEEKEDKISVVATVFSEYDWAKNVIGDSEDIELTLLLDSGADLHSFQPTFKDIMTISECDLFIYIGGESDKWVSGALKNAKNENMRVINLLEVLGESAREEEEVEGMEEEHEEGEEEAEYDEHVWLSLKNAEIFVRKIAETLAEIDGDNAAKYTANADTYISKLVTLDEKYKTAVEAANRNTLLFADRFPFLYLVEDYGLNYYAAFKGCSAESEASVQTITFLAQKADELSINVILKLESSNGRTASSVKNATANKNQTVLTLDSLQSATMEEYKEGRNYLSVMEENLEILKEALK